MRTQDSGASWAPITAPRAVVANGDGMIDCLNAPACINNLRFGSAQAGYAYSPSLFHTLDGGRSWQQEGGAVPILGLEYAGQSAFRVAGYGATYGCTGGCHIQRAAVTGAPWRETGIVVARQAAWIVPEGSQRVYVFGLANPAGGAQGKKADMYYTRNAGASWQSRVDPCPGASYTVGVATAPTWHITMLCRTDGGAPTVLIRSDDGGITFHAPIPVPFEFGLTAGSATTLSGLASGSGGQQVETTFDGGAHWRLTLTCPLGLYPFNEVLALGYQDWHTAHVICPESTVWRSGDGGATWAKSSFG